MSDLNVFRELVEAGAGCGKTYSLVSRYIEGLGIDPETGKARKTQRDPARILALTFTEDAAREMKDRVLTRLKGFELNELAARVFEEGRISTFHGHCYRALKPHLKLLGYGAEGRLLPESIVRERRMRHLFSEIERSPRRLELLRLMPAHEICAMGLELWYRLQRAETGTSSLDGMRAEGARMFDAYERLRAQLLDEVREAYDLFPQLRDADKSNWVRDIEALVHDPGLWGEVKPKFTTGPAKLRKDHAVFTERAKQFRTLLELAVPTALGSLDEEISSYAELLGFFEPAIARAPKWLDFGALEFEFNRLLELEKAGTDGVRVERPELLLVDEFQDTSPEQMQIIEGLSAPGTEWYFVGDPKQSIYAFRKAEVSLFLKLRSELPTRQLSLNRRSEAALLHGLNELTEHFLLSQAGTANAPPPQRLEAHVNERSFETSTVITALPPKSKPWSRILEDLRSNRARDPALVHGVLFMTWRRLFEFAAFLRQAGENFEIAGRARHLDHLLSQVFAEFLFWVSEPGYTKGYLALTRWWRAEAFAPPAAAALAHEARERHAELFARMGTPRSWHTLLQLFCDLVQPARWRDGAAWAASMEAQIVEFNDIGLHHELSLEDFAHFLARAVDGLDPDIDAVEDVTRGEKKPLRLMTVHGSKGLEFDCVYLAESYQSRAGARSGAVLDESENLGLQLRLFDERGNRRRSLFYERERREKLAREAAEKLRLFYVAVTRAKRRLHIYYSPRATPAKAPASDAWQALGLPPLADGYWHDLLDAFRLKHAAADEIQKVISWSDVVAGEDAEGQPDPALDAANPEGPSNADGAWYYPTLPSARATERSFFRGGVRRYLEVRHQELAGRSGAPTAAREVERDALARALPSIEAAALGSLFHQLMERWNGRTEHLESLLLGRPEHAPTLRPAALAVRALPELAEYFSSLVHHPERVFRESELLLSSPEYQLNGVADSFWHDNEGRVTLLDWKTSHYLEGFAAESKRALVRGQLGLYARAFRENARACRGLAIGVSLKPGEPPSARVVLDERLF